MRNYIIVFLFVAGIFSLASCRSDFEFKASDGKLAFSRDTVYLDTVFTNIGSSTYNLKVYNHSDSDISIPLVTLGKGAGSKYRMTVDGMTGDNGQGKIFHDVELLAKDSLYIFIEVTADVADSNPTDFLYTDQIKFDTGAKQQNVELVTLIQDAVFLYPQKFQDGTTEMLTLGSGESAQNIYGFYLDENDHNNEYHFTKDKPYVIYGYAGVEGGKTLTIDPGAKIHFHADSGIIVANGGTLQVNGDQSLTEAMENEVVFEGDRLEPEYSDVPGQWGTIWLTSGSTAQIHHTTIKNGIIGLLVDNNAGQVQIDNSRIQDCSNYGLLSRTGNIKGDNLVINNAGVATLACTYGGSYQFTHCTFNNEWPASTQVAVLVNNYIEGADPVTQPLVQAAFTNCIIYDSNRVGLLLDQSEDTGPAFNFSFKNCLVKFQDSGTRLATDPKYDAIRNQAEGNLKNLDPLFRNADISDLHISDLSPAKGKADPAAAAALPMDLDGKPRPSAPEGNYDIGAYQSILFED